MEKIKYFFILALGVLNLIGSSAYLFYYNQPFFGIVNLLVMGITFPVFKDAFKNLTK